MIRLLLLVVPIAALGGCQADSPNYRPPGDGSSGGQCQNDDGCKDMVGFPACEKPSSAPGTCKQCTASNQSACMGTTPRCESNACVACVDDQDCNGGLCLATGGCAAPSQIIHATSTSAKPNSCGDAATPCSLTGALGLVTVDKNVIKLDDAGPYMAMSGFTVASDVTIDTRGATLTRVDDKGAVLTVMSGKTLTLMGGTIQGGRGSMGSGILCNGATVTVTGFGADQSTVTTNEQFGIDATNCTLVLRRAKVENNGSTGIKASGGSITLVQTWLDTNRGGGLDISNGAQFIVVGNVFVNNGTPGSVIGGINIVTSASGNRLEFNSIAENKALTGASAGIACTADFTAKNNIVWSNNSSVANMAGIQISGACGHSYSDIGPAGITGMIDVGNNHNMDPKFKDKAADLHLTSMSPLQILQQSDPGTGLSDPKDPAVKDIDGEPRATPVNIGADQYYPPKT